MGCQGADERPMPLGASTHFRLARWDYNSYVPIVQGALENMNLLITASKRGPNGVVFQAAPRGTGDRAVEVEAQKTGRSVAVHILVYPLSLLPKEIDRFRIWDGTMRGRLANDAASRAVLGRLHAALRRDRVKRPRDWTKVSHRNRATAWVFFNFKAGRITWMLGMVAALGGLTYLVLYAPRGDYQASAPTMALLAFGAIPFLGGLWGRSAIRGAFTGAIAVFVPTLVYALAMAGTVSWGVASSQALGAIAPPSHFAGGLTYAIPLAFAAGGFIAGAFGGLFGARVFPLLPRVSKTAGM